MTQKQLIETVKQHHPNLGETQIRIFLNKALDEFCRKTRILTDTVTFNTAVDTRYYNIGNLNSSVTGEISEITRVDYNGFQIPRLVSAPEKTDIT